MDYGRDLVQAEIGGFLLRSKCATTEEALYVECNEPTHAKKGGESTRALGPGGQFIGVCSSVLLR